MSSSTPQARTRFDKQMHTLSLQLEAARTDQHASFALYKAGGRTPLFMLESLARIHRGIHNKKMFGKLYDTFKAPEDLLGAIDYYYVLYKDFGSNKDIPKNVVEYFGEGQYNAIQAMNKLLKKEKWISKKQKKLKKIHKKLDQAEWINHPEEVPAIAEFMIREIQAIKKAVTQGRLSCDDIETGVHELRRKLRWLSIYPASLNGLIQLEDGKTPAALNKYITAREKNSSFNKFPPPAKGVRIIKFNKAHFYALSWMIAELGRLKDIGLSIHALTEAISHTGVAEGKAATRKAIALSGHPDASIPALLREAAKLSDNFIKKDHVLDRLENDLARSL